MSPTIAPLNRPSPGVRFFAVLTAGAFLLTALGSAPAEASFWEERAAARARQNIPGTNAGPTLLAQLPASQPLSFGRAVAPALPSFSSRMASLGPSSLWAQAAVTPFADLRSVRGGENKAIRVFLVMDAHDVYSAQRNVAQLLSRLESQGKIVVGVEGTSGAFDLERHRGLLPGVGQAQLVDHLLKKGFLNGPEAYGLTAERTPALWGVEDAGLYDANVRAYRETLGAEAETRSALEALKRETLARQEKVFSADLQSLDREVQSMHEDRGDMGRYAKVVTSYAGEKWGTHVRRFMDAKEREDRLSFPAVEQARAAFIERVSPRLSPFEMESLVRETTAFRAGSKTATDYYRGVAAVALSKGVPVAAYPAFQSYIEFVSLTDGIDPAALMDELEVLEGRAYARLAQGDSLPLAEWSKDLRLADRALEHELTPREWTRFQERRGELARLSDRAGVLGISRVHAETLQTNLPRFAAFFEAATARNATLLENTLAEARRRGASTAVLVAGGFHAPALEKLLTGKNIPHAVLTPRIEEVPDSAAGYLQAFAPTRTPLERLLLGDRLFMNPPSNTAVSLADPANPFYSARTALTHAEMSYGTVVAATSGNLENFVALWNERFGEFGRGVVRLVKSVAEIQFSNNQNTALLVATAQTGGSSVVTEDQLDGAITGRGGKVVERGEIGDVRYSLGGRNITSIVPEVAAALGVVFLHLASGLSPPSDAGGLLAWTMAGGMVLRGILLGSHQVHEMGHALFLQWFGGASVRKSFRQYGESLSLKHLIPFSNIFIPGLSPEAESPRMSAKGLPQGWKTRVTSLVGPALNLMAAGIFFPLALLADPVSAQQLVLAAAAGVNLWVVISSGSDFKSAWRGVADYFACGVIGVVYGGPNPKGEALPSSVQALLDQATRRTLHRGGQSGGVAGVAIKENGHADVRLFVEKTAKERNRRARLDQLIREAMSRLADRAAKTGFGGLARLVLVAHTRYGTNLAAPVAENAHPHTSAGEEDTLFYVGDAKRNDFYERPWVKAHGTLKIKTFPLVRGVAIAHNGDDNETVLYQRGEGALVISNEEDARLSEHMTGFINPAKGDSPQIATRLDRWLTQGSVSASLRLTLLMLGLESLPDLKGVSPSDVLERAPTPALMGPLLQTQMIEDFPRELQRLHGKHAAAGNLEELFQSAGARLGAAESVWKLEDSIPIEAGSDLARWRDALADQGLSVLKAAPWFEALTHDEQARFSQRFADLFLKFFFTGDLRRAGIHLLRRADSTSTFGVMASSLSEAESAIWLRHLQPFYLWLSEDGKSVAGSSESSAFLGARSGDSLFRYRLTLKNGEVASIQGSRLVIDHVELGRVADYDLGHMDEVRAQARWLDMETSPYVPKPSTGDVQPEDRVRQDVEMIPWVDEKLKEDFANPTSNNSRSGQSLAELLVNRLARRSRKGIDVVIVGTEKGYDAAMLHAKALEKISSLAGRRLNTRVIYGAEFTREDLVKLRDEGFGPDTVVIGLASSGQTANTFYTLESLHAAWRGLVDTRDGPGASQTQTPPHFLVSASMDNPYTEEVLGQGLAVGDPFKSRNFVTFPALDPFHPAEAATVTHKATERLLKEVAILFADRLAKKSRRWSGGGLPPEVPGAIRQMVKNGDELDRRITGIDADGNPHRKLRQSGETNDIPDQINTVANRLSQAFLETLWATGSTALFIALTLLFHATPATLLMGWVPQGAFLFSAGVPALAAGFGLVGLGVATWKTRAWRWHPLFFMLGGVAVLSAGLLSGEIVSLGLDAIGHAVGKTGWGAIGGMLPFSVDVSPVNLVNAMTYIFFFFAFTLGLRKVQGRPLWDRMGGRILVLSDKQHSVARLSAGRWRRMVSHRFAWMGLNSINESSLGRLTHEEAPNSNTRGTVFLQGEALNAEGPTIMNFKQLGGSPNGRGRAWRLGIVHRPLDEASPAYSEGVISLFMKGDSPAEQNPDLMELQELLEHAPARDMAGMALSLAVAEKMASIPPLNFVVGMTSSEAKTSTTQQPFPPLAQEEVWKVFGVAPPSVGETVAVPRVPQPTENVVEAPLAPSRETVVEVVSASAIVAEAPVAVVAPREAPVLKEKTQPTMTPKGDRDALVALANFLGLMVQPQASVYDLADQIRVQLSFSGNVEIPLEHEQALVVALLSGHAVSPRVQMTETGGGKFVSLDTFLGNWGSRSSQFWGSPLWVSHENGVFTLSQRPRTVIVEEKNPPSSGEEDRKWKKFYRGYVLNPLRVSARVTAIVFGLLMLTSWGGTVMTTMERAISKIIEQPAARQEYQPASEVLPVSPKVLAAAPAKVFSQPVREAYVATRKTGLLAFDQPPYRNVRSLERVHAKSFVHVLSSKGSWNRVQTSSGKTGWVKSRHLFELEGHRAMVVSLEGASVFDRFPYKEAALRGSFPKGAALTVIKQEKGWTQVVPLTNPHAEPVWVSARFLKEKQTQPDPDLAVNPTRSTQSLVPTPPKVSGNADLLALGMLMGPVVPLLGAMGRKRGAVSTSPGAVLRRRLMAGERRAWEGDNRTAANELLSFVEDPVSSGLDSTDQQLLLAMGYGAVAGETWGKDRPFMDDYRRTRALVYGESLPVPVGKAVTSLARLASGWGRDRTPSFAAGALPVIDLTQGETETQLLHHWGAALDRMSQGGPAPVLIVRNPAQKARLKTKLSEWGLAHPEVDLTRLPISQWVTMDTLGSDVVQRGIDGTPVSVRLGALLRSAQVDLRNVVAVDIVTGVRTAWSWDRSDVPADIAVRMIIGLLKSLSLSAPLDTAQSAIRAARTALTAA